PISGAKGARLVVLPPPTPHGEEDTLDCVLRVLARDSVAEYGPVEIVELRPKPLRARAEVRADVGVGLALANGRSWRRQHSLGTTVFPAQKALNPPNG